MNRKSSLQIKIGILKLCKIPYSKGQIVIKLNSNNITIDKYIEELIFKKLLKYKIINLKMLFITTSNGKSVISEYEEFMDSF